MCSTPVFVVGKRFCYVFYLSVINISTFFKVTRDARQAPGESSVQLAIVHNITFITAAVKDMCTTGYVNWL